MNIQEYLTGSVENIMKSVARVALTNPVQSIFMARFALAVRAASEKRLNLEKAGEHVPAFLIASITSRCNLHCAGCYARAVHSCEDKEPVMQLSAEEWDHIFEDAEEMGISFILLAGGEPMMRRDVIEKAGSRQRIMFPIFTNGTLVDDTYIKTLKAGTLFPYSALKENKNRQIAEGEKEYTAGFSMLWMKCSRRSCCSELRLQSPRRIFER